MWQLIYHNSYSTENKWILYNDTERLCCRRFVSHTVQKTCRISHLWIPCYTRERWFKNIATNWYLTNDNLVTNNHIIISIIIMITIVKALRFFFLLVEEPHRSSIGLSYRSNNDYTMLLFISLVNYNFFSNSIAIPFLWDFLFTQQGILRCGIFRHSAIPPIRHSTNLSFYRSIIPLNRVTLLNTRYGISDLACFANLAVHWRISHWLKW